MRNTLQHPAITRAMAFGYEYDEPEVHYCQVCGRELDIEDRGPFGDWPDECWECRHGKEEELEEVES